MASSCRSRKLWTAEEDQALREAANEQLQEGGILKDWNRVASSLPGRTNKDSRKRWAKISKEVKKGTWDIEEDTRLRQAVERFGTKWTQVAEHVQTRHADQCAKRWTHSLDPEIDHSEWNEGEDERLLNAVGKKGRDWKSIAESEFPGRSKSAIKNRYLVAQNKRRKSSGGGSVLLGVTLVDPQRPAKRSASHDDDQMSISEDHLSGPGSVNLSGGHEVSSPDAYSSGEQYQCFLRPTNDELGEFPWEGLSDLPLWNMEKGCSIEGPPLHHHNGDPMYSDMTTSPFTPSLRNHSTASTESAASMMHLDQYGPMPTPYTNSSAQALCITQDDMSANSMLVAYTPSMWNGDSSTSMSSSLRDQHSHPIELISSSAGTDPQSMHGGFGTSSKTVLELEDIPQNALYEIMKIAFETKSKVRVETIHQAVSR